MLLICITRQRFSLPILVLILQVFVESLACQTPPTSTTQLFAEGNELSERYLDQRKALDKYLEALSVEPRNYELLWRISKTYLDIGEKMPSETEKEKVAQLEAYEHALLYAEKAVEAKESGSMGYTRRAVANVRLTTYRGFWESIGLYKQARADLSKAIQLDSTNHVAYYAYGRTHVKVSDKSKLIRWPLGLGWANVDEAAEYFERAIALNPESMLYRLECARLYYETDEYERARTHLSRMFSLPLLSAEDEKRAMEAADLLAKINEEEE